MRTNNEIKKKELVEVAVLWLHVSKNETEYLSGNLSEDLGSGKIIGFFNTNKKNPKEPDIRLYTVNQEGNRDIEIASLWENISKSENRYLLGKTNENEDIIGFYEEKQEKKPYIKVYFSK